MVNSDGDGVDSVDVVRLLSIEYDRLQTSIDKFDEQRFKIRAWTVTVAGAFMAFGVNVNKPVLVMLGAVFILFFFFIEVMFMEIQAKVIARSNDVERWLELARRGALEVVDREYVFGIGRVFAGAFQWRRMPRLLHHREHLTIFFVGLMALMIVVGSVLAVVA